MGAKIFISWSGELSKKLAESIRAWIPKVLQSVKPYFTPDDIEKGTKWAKEISGELAESQLGIICLTQDNQHNPWILFEAGALSKNLDEAKVCPILFNFETTDLTGPLSSFQATKFNKEEIKKLLESINNSCNESKLEQKSLDETFDMWWPKLEDEINKTLKEATITAKPKKRTDRDILEEILELTRSNSKSLLSSQRCVSNITMEELIARYRVIKDRTSVGQNVDEDIIRFENVLIQLCKELNMEEIYYHRIGLSAYALHRVRRYREDKKRDMTDSYLKNKLSDKNESDEEKI